MGLTKQSRQFIKSLPLQIGAKILTLGVQQGGEFLKEDFPLADIKSLDISNYEGADFIHDLNLPVNPSWHNTYDLLLDGGTLEHIFNLPGALENCYNLLRPGGWFVSYQTMNFCGHGFYQLCPEFYYRWARWIGLDNARCWVHSPTNSGLKFAPFNQAKRDEYASFTHLYMLFAAEKVYDRPQNSGKPWPQQAAPSTAGTFEHWFWNTKLWSKLPVKF